MQRILLSAMVLYSCGGLSAHGQEPKSRSGDFWTLEEAFPEQACAGRFVQLAIHPNHQKYYQLRAAWNAPAQPAPVKVRQSDDLLGVLIDFPGQSAPEKRSIRLDFTAADQGDQALIRAALAFFWQPRPERGPDVPRLGLVVDPVGANLKEFQLVDQLGVSGIIPRSLYAHPAGLKRVHDLLEFLKEIGTRGTGRTLLLLEEDQPPESALYVWYPDDDCWRKPQVVSPLLGGRLTPEIVEDFPTLRGQLNVGRLPRGTWDRIKQGRAGGQSGRNQPLDLISLGREGLVMGTAQPGTEPYYEVHLLRSQGGSLAYEPKPRRTPGLSVAPPPSWVRVFDLKGPWDARGRWASREGAQHLVALSVCSELVWRQDRSRSGESSAWHLGKLFCDPELWAIPE